MSSHRATTTALVVDSPLSRDEVRAALRASLEAGGWLDPRWCTPEVEAAQLEQALHLVTRVAEHFPVGSVVRRRIDQYTAEVA